MTSTDIIFNDTSPLDKKKEENKWLDKEVSSAILEVIYNKLSEKESISIIGNEKGPARQNEEKILYRPYESFTHCPDWCAGRYVGEFVIKLSNNDFPGYINKSQMKIPKEPVRLIIKPRMGTNRLCRMIEEIFNYRLPESITRAKDGDDWNSLYQLILRHLWLIKFAKADKYGLPRQTVKRIHQGVQIRGHINVKKSIKPFFLNQEVVSEYWEKELDDTIGRIVYKAYDILAKGSLITSNIPPQVKESINDLYSRYHGEQINISEHDYQRIQYKSIYMSWKSLVDFSWQVIKHNGFDPNQTMDDNGYALFFDMSEIWESYMGKVLNNYFKHYTERNSKFSLFDGFNQKIIPDYLSNDYTTENETAQAVGDAKYMDLAEKYKLQGEQTYSVYYKTIMYMHRFNSKKGFIFYPLIDETQDYTGNEAIIEALHIKGTESYIYMVGFRVPQNNEKSVYENFKMQIEGVLNK